MGKPSLQVYVVRAFLYVYNKNIMKYIGYCIGVRGSHTDMNIVVRENEGVFDTPQAMADHFNTEKMRRIRFDGDDANASLMAVPVHKDNYGSIHGVRYNPNGEGYNPDIVDFRREYTYCTDTGKSYDMLVVNNK